jgi:hypothetical protein
VTRADAEARCAELNESDVRDGGRWMVREQHAGDWRAVRVNVPGMKARDPLKASVESRPRPEEPADPRPAIFRNIPPFGPG